MASKPPPTKLSLFGALNHILAALDREYRLLTKTDRKNLGPEWRILRSDLAKLNDALTHAQAKRSEKRGPR